MVDARVLKLTTPCMFYVYSMFQLQTLSIKINTLLWTI